MRSGLRLHNFSEPTRDLIARADFEPTAPAYALYRPHGASNSARSLQIPNKFSA